jgi:NADP-dependent 3-hydroxy acid dehydrogenase YdfG
MTPMIKATAVDEEITVVVITGASSGIGEATAIACAQAGMRVVAAARRADLLEAVVECCRAAGGEAVAVPTDVRSAADVQRLVATALTTYGRIDVMIANAGTGFHTPLAEATDEQLRDIVDLNVLGVMRCARAAAPHMIARGRGHIITVSSAAIALMWPNDSVYAATKAAVHRFARGLRNELRPHGVFVTDVIPGVIETPLTSGLRGESKADPRIVADAIVRVIASPRDELIVPARYRLLMALARLF